MGAGVPLMNARPAGSFRFASDTVPKHKRTGLWREVMARQCLGMDSDPLPDVPFFVDLRVRELTGVTIAAVALSGTRDKRTPETLSDGNHDFLFTINLGGAFGVSHRGRESIMGAGEGVLQSMGETGTYTRPVFGRGLALRLPRAALSALVSHPDDLAGRTICAGNTALRLLAGYSQEIDARFASTFRSLRHATASHLLDLVSLTLWSAFQAQVEATREGARAAFLHRIKTDILRNLAKSDLSLGTTAARHGVAPRTIQRLFAADDTSFSDFVAAQRLQQVFDRLCDPRFSDRSVTTLAFEAGWGDLSTFYRTFRRRFGVSPLDVRKSAHT